MTAERMEFRTEMKQLMDIIINSLYSNKDIFLRELISNANDAIDKLRFEAITRPDLLGGDPELKIRLSIDKDARTLTISDNGIGMGRETIVEDLGTIAKSGTRAFLDKLKSAEVKERPELIGQFGVGFYSAFMVADRVAVLSRAAGEDKAVCWESDGQGTFTVEDAEKPGRGTDVILHLKEAEGGYLEPYRLREIVETFSNFVEHPIVMESEVPPQEEGGEPTREDQVLNRSKAIWLRRKNEITPEECNEFYKHLTRDFEDPAKVIHYIAEGGAVEFKSLLFLPDRRPFSFFDPDDKRGVQLYIHRVFIQDNYEHLLPRYLRFVRGVVEASDLPLNVSREMLQENQMLATIKNNLTDKVLDALTEMKRDEPEKYRRFFKNFGGMIREGVATDYARKEQLADLLLYDSLRTEEGAPLALAEYVDAMLPDQEAIYYLLGEKREQVANSPYLEVFKAKGYDVLLMTDPIDEWVVQSLRKYKEKDVKAADEGDLKLDPSSDGSEKTERSAAFEGLLGHLRENLKEVKDVRLSGRLKESAAVLVRDEGDLPRHMEAMMKQLRPGEADFESRRILELNPEHPAVKVMQARFDAAQEDPKVLDYARLFFDQALLAEGRMPEDPVAFARRVNALIVGEV